MTHSLEVGFGDVIALTLFSVGFLFEAIGDFQLALFKRNPLNEGKIMTTGLWHYTRHPNYFGDFLVWWGLYAFSASTHRGWWSVFSPIVMAILLLRISGVSLTEKNMRGRQGYNDYAARTSPFIPWKPLPAENDEARDSIGEALSSRGAREDENGVVYD
eukprot:GHVN01048295.1.p1 GENE.GHVN01048295.1~~GHVN01048295.1.p1  ORF type:complete len:159 (-),score=27.13 GHVN01048295.1:147-623(-)